MFHAIGLLDFDAPELLLILAILLVLFGGRKLPELSKNLGSSLRELRKGMSEESNEEKHDGKSA